MRAHTLVTKFIRDIIFGAEDGLVSILGLVVGVAGATSSSSTIVVSGMAGAVAAAISMSAGDYISTKSQKEVLQSARKRSSMIHPLASALIMGSVFFTMSAFPITPYLFFPVEQATKIAIAATFSALFLIGAAKTHITKRNWLKSGFEMVMVGGIAAAAGFLVGNAFSI